MGNKLHDKTYLFNVKGVNIIGNAQNGAIIGLDKSGLEFIHDIGQNKPSTISLLQQEQLMNALKQYGYFEKQEKSLKNTYLHVTDRCNLSCAGCYSYVENRNMRDELSVKKLIEIVDQLSSCGVGGVVISGGEPFLREDIVQILAHLKDLNIQVSVITNGTINWEIVEKAVPFIDILNVSVDGYNRETKFIRNDGIMDKVLDFIIHFKEIIPINLIFTIHKQNVDYMKKYIDLAADLNVSFNFSIFTVDPYDETLSHLVLEKNDIIKIANLINEEDDIYIEDSIVHGHSDGVDGLCCRTGCGLGHSIISIAANGDVFPCHMLHTPDFKLGNLCVNSLKTILEKQRNIWDTLTVNSIKDCETCEYKYLCGGGCRGRSYLYNNTLTNKDPFCLLTKMYLDQRTKIFNKFTQEK